MKREQTVRGKNNVIAQQAQPRNDGARRQLVPRPFQQARTVVYEFLHLVFQLKTQFFASAASFRKSSGDLASE